MFSKNSAGFTLFEIVVVIAILITLSTVVVFDFISVRKKIDLNNSVQEFVSILKLAQNKTVSSENYKQYGVYVNAGALPNQYVLFEGSSYALRTLTLDRIYSLPDTMEFYNVNFNGGNEIVFEKLTGAANNPGDVSVRIKADVTRSKTIYVGSSGAVDFVLPPSPSDDDRVKDSRHVEFNYNRTIDIANEIMLLNFDDTKTEPVMVGSHLTGGELYWQGTVDVSGSNQIIKISTRGLSSGNAIFSIHRDRGYNNKSLKITISGDSSGTLIEYSADGEDVEHSSIYASDFIWR